MAERRAFTAATPNSSMSSRPGLSSSFAAAVTAEACSGVIRPRCAADRESR